MLSDERGAKSKTHGVIATANNVKREKQSPECTLEIAASPPLAAPRNDVYHQFAELFAYPTAAMPQRVAAVQTLLDAHYPEAGEVLRPFGRHMASADLHRLEELFTRSFDIQAVTTLDVGYLLFGDDYKRGELLSHLNKEHVAAGIDCRRELADHLPNVLRLLAQLTDTELRQELVEEIIAPALQKMLEEFQPGRTEERNVLYKKHYKTLLELPSGSPLIYACLIQALSIVLMQDFEIKDRAMPVRTSDFLKSVNVEMELS